MKTPNTKLQTPEKLQSSSEGGAFELELWSFHDKNLQHLVPVMVDDFDGDFAGLGFVEGAAHGRVE
jgi:hypothetical protein